MLWESLVESTGRIQYPRVAYHCLLTTAAADTHIIKEHLTKVHQSLPHVNLVVPKWKNLPLLLIIHPINYHFHAFPALLPIILVLWFCFVTFGFISSHNVCYCFNILFAQIIQINTRQTLLLPSLPWTLDSRVSTFDNNSCSPIDALLLCYSERRKWEMWGVLDAFLQHIFSRATLSTLDSQLCWELTGLYIAV